MRVKQISIFLENKSGRLAAVTQLLGEAGVNIRALSIADTSDFGILRLIVNEPARAYATLKEAGFTVSETDVIAVELPDRPGGLADVLGLLHNNGINVEYLYAFVSHSTGTAMVLLKARHLDRAVELLRANGITVPKAATVYNL